MAKGKKKAKVVKVRMATNVHPGAEIEFVIQANFGGMPLDEFKLMVSGLRTRLQNEAAVFCEGKKLNVHIGHGRLVKDLSDLEDEWELEEDYGQ